MASWVGTNRFDADLLGLLPDLLVVVGEGIV